jgi:hypothetical protein
LEGGSFGAEHLACSCRYEVHESGIKDERTTLLTCTPSNVPSSLRVACMDLLSGSEFLLEPVFSIPEEANHGICPNQDMNERTKEIFRVDLWSLEIFGHQRIDHTTASPFHPLVEGRPPSKCPPVGHLYDGGRFDLLWRSWSFQVFD